MSILVIPGFLVEKGDGKHQWFDSPPHVKQCVGFVHAEDQRDDRITKARVQVVVDAHLINDITSLTIINHVM